MLGIDKGMIAVTMNQGYLVNYQLPIDKIGKEFYSKRLDRPEPIVMAICGRFGLVWTLIIEYRAMTTTCHPDSIGMTLMKSKRR